jgi:hypothetical protein
MVGIEWCKIDIIFYELFGWWDGYLVQLIGEYNKLDLKFE